MRRFKECALLAIPDCGDAIHTPRTRNAQTTAVSGELDHFRTNKVRRRAKAQGISDDDKALITREHDQQLLADIKLAITDVAEECRRANFFLAIYSFLLYVLRSANTQRLAVMELYRHGGSSAGFADVHLVTIFVTGFYDSMLAADRLAQTYCHDLARYVASILEALGKAVDRRYPPYRLMLFRVANAIGHTATLGEQDWLELRDVESGKRNSVGLALVRKAAFERFRLDLAVFEFGRTFVHGCAPPAGVDANAWLALWRLITDARSRIKDRVSNPILSVTKVLGEYDPALRDAETWAAAGMPSMILEASFPPHKTLQAHGLAALVLRCLCTTAGSVLAAAYVIACDTGLNKEPIATSAKTRSRFAQRKSSASQAKRFSRL